MRTIYNILSKALLTISFAGITSCDIKGDNSLFIPEDTTPAKAAHASSWKIDTISTGLRLHTFMGKDPVSGSMQIVNVLDVDLSVDRYQVKFSYKEEGSITSDIMKKYGAVGCLNATYEKESCYIKVDNNIYETIRSDVIPGTSVPQWKSEGAVYTDGEQNVSVSFTAKGMDLKETRAIYAKSTSANIFTSSPMLIDNYEIVGAYFVPEGYSEAQMLALNYEDPIRHQGVRHPRSAVAITADKHFLMIAVDGRREGVSEGMSAKELTIFLKDNFNPQYALNMDGGGSTTLCVKGRGEPGTYVVNYPTDNEAFDHLGERRVPTHFYIIDTQIK